MNTTEIANLIAEFLSSKHEAVRVDGWDEDNNYLAATKFRNWIDYNGITGVKCIARKGKVYLVRT